MKSYLYVRGLRIVEHSVFAVQKDLNNPSNKRSVTKTYRDPVFKQEVAYSSGQQVKRSILDFLTDIIDEGRSSATFNYKVTNSELTNKEIWSACDPTFADQLIGGWMQTGADASEGDDSETEDKKSKKKKEGNVDLVNLKRRSPLSISAMRPLHPLLATMNRENLTFDRSDSLSQKVRVTNSAGQEMSENEIADFLASNNRSLPLRHWLPINDRTTGLFVFDIAIDLSRLFSVSTNILKGDVEVTSKTLKNLKAQGWVLSPNGERLICPAERRNQLIPALAKALVEWHITSNQARTYSPQTTLALAISENASLIASAIRADLNEEDMKKADPIVESFEGVETFISLSCKGHVRGVVGAVDAMQQAEKRITEYLSVYDYDK